METPYEKFLLPLLNQHPIQIRELQPTKRFNNLLTIYTLNITRTCASSSSHILFVLQGINIAAKFVAKNKKNEKTKMLLMTKTNTKRDRDTSELRKISLLLLLLTICSIAIIIGYTFMLYQLEAKVSTDTVTSNDSGPISPISTRPIEKPRTFVNTVNTVNVNRSPIEPEKYNEFEVKSRLLREKIELISGKKKDVKHLPPANGTTENVHIFYSAPVRWYRSQSPSNSVNTSIEPEPTDRSVYDVPNIVFQPMLGLYSINTKILKKHFQNLKDVGIGVIILTWRPDKSATDMLKNILNFVKQYFSGDIKVAIEIDTYPNRTAVGIRNALEFFHREFIWSHPSLYRVFVISKDKHLPMIYVKNATDIGYRNWSRILSERELYTIRKTIYDAVFIGHVSTKSHLNHLRQGSFDGLYPRIVSNGATYTSTWKNWETVKKLAEKYKLLFIPTVGPGYNERKKEPKMGGFRRHRSNGQYYDVGWRTALANHIQFISIHSYNDWPTGTQIEEAISLAGYKDYEPAGPYKYLELTKRWIVEFLHSKEKSEKQRQQRDYHNNKQQQQQQQHLEQLSCDDLMNNTIC